MIAGRGEDRDHIEHKGRTIRKFDRIKALRQHRAARAAEYQRERLARRSLPAREFMPVDPVQDHFLAVPVGPHRAAEITDEIVGGQLVDRFHGLLAFRS